MLHVFPVAFWTVPSVVILFGPPQVFTYIAMVTTPTVFLCVNHHYLSARAATKRALKPISHVHLVPPAPTAGFAMIGFVRNNYFISHARQYKHGQNRD
jgi:hypothetical protein